MKIKLSIQNVVSVQPTFITTYPFQMDYSETLMAYEIVVKNGETYTKSIYPIEASEIENYYELDLSYLGEKEIFDYIQYQNLERVAESQRVGDSFNALVGDTVKVYKGRKNVGLEIVVASDYTFYDCFNRPQAYYWISEKGERVNKEHSIITKGA